MPNGNGTNSEKSNSWSSKATASKTFTQKELNVLIKQVINTERNKWNKEAKTKSGKHKQDEANMLESDDSNSIESDKLASKSNSDSEEMSITSAKALDTDDEEPNSD